MGWKKKSANTTSSFSNLKDAASLHFVNPNGVFFMLLLESRSINEEDFQLIQPHLLHFDNSLMKKKKKKKSLLLLVRITHTGPMIAFHSSPVSEYGSSIKLTNCWTFGILTPWAERKERKKGRKQNLIGHKRRKKRE